MKKISKTVIPAAGFGTRFLPASKAVPKEMAVILDRPAIQWIVEEAIAAGSNDIIIVTNEWKTALKAHFSNIEELDEHLAKRGERPAPLTELDEISKHVRFVNQTEQRGLGHAVLCAAEAVGDEPFFVLLGDALVRSEIPCAEQMRQVCEKVGGHSVIGLQQVPEDRVSRYGIVAGEEVEEGVFKLTDLVEKPSPETAPSNLAIAGRYILTGSIFEKLRHQTPGHGGEIQLTDAVKRLLAEEPVYGYVYKGQRHDIGNPAGYLDTSIAYARDHKSFLEKMTVSL